MTRSALILPLVLLCGLATPVEPAWAQQKPTPQSGPRPAPPANPRAPGGAGGPGAQAPAPESVNLQLMVVHATNGAAWVDPKLGGIERHLKMLSYSRYQVLSTDKAVMKADKTTTFQVEGGRQVRVTLLSVTDARAQVRVEMLRASDKILDTTVSINRGGTFIVGGPKHEGGILLLPITASY